MPRAVKTLLFSACVLCVRRAGGGATLHPGIGRQPFLGLRHRRRRAAGWRCSTSVSSASGSIISSSTRASRARPPPAARARLPRALEQHKPAVVVIELGGNDGLRGLPVAEMKRNLAAMIQQSAGRPARACCWSACGSLPTTARTTRRTSMPCSTSWRSSTSTALVPFLMEDFADKPDFFLPDRIHPDRGGAAADARAGLEGAAAAAQVTVSFAGPARQPADHLRFGESALLELLEHSPRTACGAHATSSPPLVCGSLISLRFQSSAPLSSTSCAVTFPVPVGGAGGDALLRPVEGLGDDGQIAER